jgi:hypothetical protein
VLAIFGNVITAWSWFGTNQLSIGLHAYGFDSRLADGCFNFWMCQLFIITWGLIPRRFWASAARRSASTPLANTASPLGGLESSPLAGVAMEVPHTSGQSRRVKGKKSDRRH